MTPKTVHSGKEAEKKAREGLRALAAGLRRAARHPGQAESIHRLRVAIRRFTQVLRVFSDQFDHTRKMRRRLRGLMDLCGAARNCDVALEVLEAAGSPADAGLKKRLKRRRDRAARDLANLLKDDDLRGHLRRWRGWLKAKPGDSLASDALVLLVSKFPESGAAAAKAGAAFAQMHQFRLLVKRFRYTLEILGSGEAQLTALRGLQERLGSINDCVTTADLISEMNLRIPERRRIKAALNRLLEHRAAEFRAYWRDHFGRKTKATPELVKAKRRSG